VNGKRIYDESCSHCHGVVEGIVDLKDANTWLGEVQVMAKLRKLPNWEDANKGAKYASSAWNAMRLAQAFGLRPAFAQDPGAGSAPPAAGAPPEGGAPADAAAGDDSEQIFPDNAMPYYASDILSDKDVVDVACYVIRDLPKAAAAEAPPAGAAASKDQPAGAPAQKAGSGA
jgi:mono/diheme cytochrome c family protein